MLPPNTTTTQFTELEPSFQNVFRHTWADHANLISVQYAGTGALKTDYTRTGKVTFLINYIRIVLVSTYDNKLTSQY